MGRDYPSAARYAERTRGKPRGVMLDEDGETFRGFVEITNFGQTPAFNVTAPAKIAIQPPPLHRFKIASQKISEKEASSLPVMTLPKDGQNVVVPKEKISYADLIASLATNNRLCIWPDHL